MASKTKSGIRGTRRRGAPSAAAARRSPVAARADGSASPGYARVHACPARERGRWSASVLVVFKLRHFLKAPGPVTRQRRARNVAFVGADVYPGSEEYRQLDGRDEKAQRLALNIPSSFTSVTNVAKFAAQHEPHVGRKAGPDDKPKPIKNHPFETVLWNPNKWMSPTFLWWWLYTALPITGHAYLFIEDNGYAEGDVQEIWPIPPWRMKAVPSLDSRTFVTHYNYWPETGAEPIKLPASNVCWVRIPDIRDVHAGQSMVLPGRLPLATASKQWVFRDRFWGPRRGRPETAIGIKREVSLTEFERLKHEILSQFQVLDRGTLVHRAGDIDVKMLGMSADDMQLLGFQDHDAKVLKELFGWNDALGKATSYAMADVALEVVAKGSVWPLMKLVAGALSNQVVRPRYGDDLCAYYNHGDVIPTRRNEERADCTVYGPEMTTNELRKKRGLEPITTGPFAEAYSEITTRTLPAYFQAQAGKTSEKEPDAPQVSDEVKADLVKWERKATRVFTENGHADASFESEYIPLLLGEGITQALEFVTDENDIKRVFQCVLG